MSEEISLIDELRELLDRRPFQPFFIVRESGHRYEVTGRHQVAIGRSVIVLLGEDMPSMHLRVSSISSIEETQPIR